MAHLHFGAAVPVVFRSFPSVRGHSLAQPRRTLALPDELPGALKLVLLAFNKKHHRELESWTPLLASLQEKFRARNPDSPGALKTYHIVLRSRSARLFSWYLEERWRLLLLPTPPSSSSAASAVPVSQAPSPAGASSGAPHSAGTAAASVPSAFAAFSARSLSSAKCGEALARPTEPSAAAYAAALNSTFFAYVDRRAFLARASLPDCQRPYLFLLDEKNKITWCEHEAFGADKALAVHEIHRLMDLPPEDSKLRLDASNVGERTHLAASPEEPLPALLHGENERRGSEKTGNEA
ncbi:hypothetical protein BESB_030470 [Besnoitia besnoiti]|uniref:Uncharacterized protein n=1 Tax=Besnoitia besnoiti TaxID=94643 RepID=A0A2A9M698_BESBE|nr:hypothetical protein BESB_030470 [Besnoitia besnoiti]PFH31173.1 hypothetical protein BESB_030470 [Besnoitia besnoiti]